MYGGVRSITVEMCQVDIGHGRCGIIDRSRMVKVICGEGGGMRVDT